MLFTFIISCKSTQGVAGTTSANPSGTKGIVASHYKNNVNFDTASGRIKLTMEKGGDKQSFTLSYRAKKGEVIWISAPLGVIKAKITQDKVAFFNRLDQEYFDGDFSYLSKELGVDVNFESLEHLLWGGTIVDLKSLNLKSQKSNEGYLLKIKIR